MKTIEDLLKELSGVLGKTGEKLRLMYLFEINPEAKRMIESRIKLLHNQYFGSDEKIVLPPPSADKATGEYLLGAVQYNEKNLCPFGLRTEELCCHTIITGRSGSGKSNCITLLAKQFIEKKKPFILFSYKREYRDLALEFADSDKGVLTFTCGRNAPFRFNPLQLPKGYDNDKESWINLIAENISRVYFLGEGAISIIRKGLTEIYAKYKHPKIKHLKLWLEEFKGAKGRVPDWLSSTTRAIDAMCFGRLGDILNSDSPIDIEKLLTKQTIIELDVLNADDRDLIVSCLFQWIYKYAIENFKRNQFNFALFCDEAHHLFTKRQTDITGKESVADSMLRMARELGLAFFLGDQHSSLISRPALGNTFYTIALNQKTREDVNAIGNAMLLSDEQKEYLGKLPVGYAIVKLQDRIMDAFLIQIPKATLTKGRITEEQILEIAEKVYPQLCYDCKDDDMTKTEIIREIKSGNSGMLSVINDGVTGNSFSQDIPEFPSEDSIGKIENADSAEMPESAESSECVEFAGYKECGRPIINYPVPEAKDSMFDSKANEAELMKQFLLSIVEKPFLGTSRRYSELEISTRRGNIVKDKLVKDGYITPVLIHIKNNLMTLFDLTDKAKDYLRTLGCRIIENKREGGMEHKFGVNYVEQLYKRNGYNVELEKPTKNGKFIDLVATKNNEKECIVVACQVETGKSDILENVDAAFEDGYSKVRMVATNYPAMIKIKKRLDGYKIKPGQSLQISYLLPRVD